MKVEGTYGFEVDSDRLKEIVRRAYTALIERKGVFSEGDEKFLPQYNLPGIFEYSPRREEVKEPEIAAKYLWTCSFMERRFQSKVIIKNALNVWNNPDTNWFFFPEEVAKRPVEEVEWVMGERFKNELSGKNEAPPGERFHWNAQKMVEEYGGDPRNMVKNYSVDEARNNIIEFKGFGSGIANLYLQYLYDRKIAVPTNPSELLFKVDVHKGRIPVNTDAIIPLWSEIRRDKLANFLEGAYLQAVKELGIGATMADRALWIIGTQLCARPSYDACNFCPLEDMCTSNVREDSNTGRYVVFENGQRVERRTGDRQLKLFNLFSD